MAYAVQLTYFRQTGRFLASAEVSIVRSSIAEIWDEVDDLRRGGRLPGLRTGAGRDLIILVNVLEHPQHEPHLVMAPLLGEDDVTPPRDATGARVPLVRIPLEEIPREYEVDEDAPTIVGTGSTSDEEITPIEIPIPSPPDDVSSE